MRIIVKVKDMEKESAGNDDKNMMLYNEKWQNIENMFIFFKKKIMLVSILIQMSGGGVLCFIFLFILNIFVFFIYFFFLIFSLLFLLILLFAVFILLLLSFCSCYSC